MDNRTESMWLSLLLALVVPAAAHAQFGERRGAQLFTMLSDGSEIRPLVRVPEKIWHGSPDLSHNGKWIAFDASPELYGGDPAHVYVAALDKPEGRLYDLGPGNGPRWSSDDDTLTFYLRPRNPENLKPGIWTMGADGSQRTWICEGQKPNWSPDGTRIAVASDHEGPGSLYVVTPRYRKRVLISGCDRVAGASWSPDGQQLAYISVRGKIRELGVVSARGDGTKPTVRYEGDLAWFPSWSPDGRRILFSMRGSDGAMKLATVNLDDDRPPTVFAGQDEQFNSDAAWSPDGKRVVFNRIEFAPK